MAAVKKRVTKQSSVSKKKPKIKIAYSSPKLKSPQEEIKSRQKDGLKIYSILGANLDERDFFDRWERLGKALSPTELAGLGDERKKELELSRKKEIEIKEKIGSVCFRLRFIEALQYDNRFTRRDESFQSDALQIYLLCTCFDTLAGQFSHKQFDNWVSEIGEDLLQTSLNSESNQELTIWYKQTTKRLFEKYLQDYGVARNFRRLFNELPDILRISLIDSFTVIREKETNEDWNGMPPERKLRRIVDYLFSRRNKFTHNSDIVPTLNSKEDFHIIEINDKRHKIYISDIDEIRNERTILTFVLIGALRFLLGYQIDEQFSKLYWFIEKNKTQFRYILKDLKHNYSLRSLYLSNLPVDLAKSPAYLRPRYFRTDAIDTVLNNDEVNLEWFFYDPSVTLDADIRNNLAIYTKLMKTLNLLLKKYEIQSSKPKALDKTKTAAYDKFCQKLKNIDLDSITENMMTDFYYMLDSAPQIPVDISI